MLCGAGNQLSSLAHSTSSYVHGNPATWPSVAQWAVGASDVHQARQSRSSILVGAGDQHKDMADMFNLMDNTATEFNDLSGMFNNYS